jgi:hypothetical protein
VVDFQLRHPRASCDLDALNLLARWAATTDVFEQAATTNDPEPAEPVERPD